MAKQDQTATRNVTGNSVAAQSVVTTKGDTATAGIRTICTMERFAEIVRDAKNLGEIVAKSGLTESSVKNKLSRLRTLLETEGVEVPSFAKPRGSADAKALAKLFRGESTKVQGEVGGPTGKQTVS